MTLNRSLRALGEELLCHLSGEERAQLGRDPGLLFFPKMIVELGSSESNVPAGASADYISLAVQKLMEKIDQGKTKRFGSGFLSLLGSEIQRELAEARILEQDLLNLVARHNKGGKP